MLNVCIVVHDNIDVSICVEHAYYTNIYLLNVSISYVCICTTFDCVNTLIIQTIYMLNVSI